MQATLRRSGWCGVAGVSVGVCVVPIIVVPSCALTALSVRSLPIWFPPGPEYSAGCWSQQWPIRADLRSQTARLHRAPRLGVRDRGGRGGELPEERLEGRPVGREPRRIRRRSALGVHPGGVRARLDQHHIDPEGCPLLVPGLGQPLQGEPAGAVQPEEGQGQPSEHGADLDEQPATLPAQLRQRGSVHPQRAEDVGVELLQHLLGREGLERTGGEGPGVV